MIQELTDLPENMVGFKANGKVTKEDFQNVVIPSVKRFIKKTGYLNYLFILESKYPDYTPGAWFEDAMLGLRHLTKWNRAAIVSYSGDIVGLTDIFSHVTPGEFRGFHYTNLNAAISWASQPKVNHTANILNATLEILNFKKPENNKSNVSNNNANSESTLFSGFQKRIPLFLKKMDTLFKEFS